MRSRRALLSLLLCFAFDAAMPYELAARGGFQLEAEDQDEEAVRAERRRAERPGPADLRLQRPPASPTLAPGRVAWAPHGARAAAAAAEAPDRAAPRARIHAPDPASPAEDH